MEKVVISREHGHAARLATWQIWRNLNLCNAAPRVVLRAEARKHKVPANECNNIDTGADSSDLVLGPTLPSGPRHGPRTPRLGPRLFSPVNRRPLLGSNSIPPASRPARRMASRSQQRSGFESHQYAFSHHQAAEPLVNRVLQMNYLP